jgi:Reverse transcriptase (RNA-dependent DNA polymerase)
MSSIRIVLGLAASLDLEIEQLDVKIACLHDLEEELYMEQPEGFVVKGQEHLVCKLRNLYGLKQASQNWYKMIKSFLCDNKFEKINSDNYVFVKKILY